MDRINGLYTILNGLGKRIFQNKNLSAGIPGTQVDAGYMTDLQEEVVQTITLSGQTPMSGVVQLPAAIATLSKLAASGNYQGVTAIIANTTVTAVEAGQLLEITAAFAVTVALPSPVGLPGESYLVWNNTAYANTITTPAGDFVGPGGTGTASYSIAPGQTAEFTSDNNNWLMQTEGAAVAGNWTLSLANTTLVVPAWAGQMEFDVIGGGGSGGVSTTSATRGAGGAAAGRARGIANVTPGASLPVVVGTGGASVASGSGNSGGASYITGIVQASGGGSGSGTSPYAGGISGTGTGLGTGGALGGGTTNGAYAIYEGLGDGGDGNINASQPGGDGGGPGGRGATGQSGYPGRGYGGGGGGCCTSYNSGAGNGGYVLTRFLSA